MARFVLETSRELNEIESIESDIVWLYVSMSYKTSSAVQVEAHLQEQYVSGYFVNVPH